MPVSTSLNTLRPNPDKPAAQARTSPGEAPKKRAGKELVIDDLAMLQKKKTVYGPISFTANPGSLLVIDGPVGSGRTCVLLTIGGRMKPSTGTGRVAGFDLRTQMKQIRRQVALGPFPQLNELDQALSVQQHVAEQLLLHRFGFSIGSARVAAAIDAMNSQLDAAEPLARRAHAIVIGTPIPGDADLLPRLQGSERIADLTPLERFTLSTLLALMDGPELLLVDDVDQLRAVDDRARAWGLLTALRATHPGQPLTIVASCEHDGLDPDVIEDLADIAGRELLIYDLPGRRLAARTSSSTSSTTR
ncbi:ABC transporter [Propionibacterium cyclohexanicum]|uniref:ABC transporter n=1 Tax=Propionibacterium cyclohexanicum TaxID=64702 RepID=A0A1H9SP92_9ACTN|nr:ATP-binding cassette domain-containing protein [Propionibacterium cyclohexanicum]SER86213.1 ABC transporter [Propionibacterium cyclohexanicum]